MWHVALYKIRLLFLILMSLLDYAMCVAMASETCHHLKLSVILAFGKLFFLIADVVFFVCFIKCQKWHNPYEINTKSGRSLLGVTAELSARRIVPSFLKYA